MKSITYWVEEQTNTALHNPGEVDFACTQAERAGFPLHPDRNKNWDSFLAAWHTADTTYPGFRILDAGAGRESVYLPSLKTLGYTELVGLNLDRHDDADEGIKNGIKYMYGDMTKTIFPDGWFGFIACLSVIEHGVDAEAFLKEASRLLRRGCHLFISFDYWAEKIDTGGRTTHDAPWNLFSYNDVDNLIHVAERNGLVLSSQEYSHNFSCDQKVINWAGLGYTFANLLFQRTR